MIRRIIRRTANGRRNISGCRTATAIAASAASSTIISTASTTTGSSNFAYTRGVGETFVDLYPRLVRAKMHQDFTAEQRLAQLRYRGLYAEFNLVYDRGTTFGLKTGGNVDAILMSLPPEARWD